MALKSMGCSGHLGSVVSPSGQVYKQHTTPSPRGASVGVRGSKKTQLPNYLSAEHRMEVGLDFGLWAHEASQG